MLELNETNNMTDNATTDQNDKIAKLWAALAKAQTKLKTIPKSGLNPHFRSKYATLDDILKIALPTFGSCGISITQWNSTTDRGVKVRTVIGHEDGASISDELELPCDISKPQSFGSAFTYARRYALQSALGIAAEEDDDGIVAQSSSTNQRRGVTSKPKNAARKVPGTDPKFTFD